MATKLALRDLPPLTIAFLRFLTASAILYPLWRFSPERTATRPGRRQMLLGGLVGVTLYFTLENLGVQLNRVAAAAEDDHRCESGEEVLGQEPSRPPTISVNGNPGSVTWRTRP